MVSEVYRIKRKTLVLTINKDSVSLIPETPGCYWLIRMDGNSPKPIGRVSGNDNHGILYIGQSSNLRRRFQDMLKQFCKESAQISVTAKEGHPASYEWHFSSQNRLAHPLPTIRYAFEAANPGDDVVYKELVYLANYREQFGEYPPWNQPPSKYRPYLPKDNPQGFYPVKYDSTCLTWLPPVFR